jgi:O-antigen ligase
VDRAVLIGAARRLAVGLAELFSGRSPRAMATIVFFLAVPQLYLLPRGSSDVAVTTIITALLLPGVLVAARRSPRQALFRTGPFLVLVGLLAIRIVALAWSPNPRSGLPLIVFLGQFIVTLMIMSEAVRQDPGLLRRLQRMYWPWVVVEAALVILFRVLPGVEDLFLRAVGGVFTGQNTIGALFGSGPNNVFDVAKSGGVFVNANVAGLFLGVNGVAALAISSITHTRWVRMTGVAALVTVPFTGSKSATLLAIALPAFAFGVYRVSVSMTPAVRRYLLIALGMLIPAGTAVLLLSASALGLAGALVKSFNDRTAIWGFGAEAFLRSPVLGLGYGGWDIGFASYAREHGVYRMFPPHNVLIAAWSTTGIAGLVLSAVFFALTFHLVFRGWSQRPDDGKKFVTWAGVAVGWILIHGMGDNTDVFGEIHLIPIVSLLIAYIIRDIGEESKRGRHAYRRHRAAPAIPAVGDVHRQPGIGAAQLPAVVRGQRRGSRHARN